MDGRRDRQRDGRMDGRTEESREESPDEPKTCMPAHPTVRSILYIEVWLYDDDRTEKRGRLVGPVFDLVSLIPFVY